MASSINRIATYYPKTPIFGFDSFEGLPEDWSGPWIKGSFDMNGNLPRVHPNVQLIKGWFDDTIPEFKIKLAANARGVSVQEVEASLTGESERVEIGERERENDDEGEKEEEEEEEREREEEEEKEEDERITRKERKKTDNDDDDDDNDDDDEKEEEEEEEEIDFDDDDDDEEEKEKDNDKNANETAEEEDKDSEIKNKKSKEKDEKIDSSLFSKKKNTPKPYVEIPYKIGLLHVDCDLYSSTKTVFHHFKNNIREGTVIVFDELLNFDGYERHEIRALYELVRDHGFTFDIIGIECITTCQPVAIIITGRNIINKT